MALLTRTLLLQLMLISDIAEWLTRRELWRKQWWSLIVFRICMKSYEICYMFVASHSVIYLIDRCENGLCSISERQCCWIKVSNSIVFVLWHNRVNHSLLLYSRQLLVFCIIEAVVTLCISHLQIIYTALLFTIPLVIFPTIGVVSCCNMKRNLISIISCVIYSKLLNNTIAVGVVCGSMLDCFPWYLFHLLTMWCYPA